MECTNVQKASEDLRGPGRVSQMLDDRELGFQTGALGQETEIGLQQNLVLI